MGERRNRHDVSGGKALREDDSILDVTAWREDVTVKLVDIKDEVNDEAEAIRQTIVNEHTTTRATIESVGEEIEANNTAEHTATRATITTEGNETQTAISDLQTEVNDEAAATRTTIITKSNEEQVKLDTLEASLTAIQTEINDEAATTRSTITTEGGQTQTAIAALQTEVNDEAATTRGTITTKSDEEQVKLDEIEAAINAEAALTRTIITSAHARVHAGQMFTSWVNDGTMSTNDTINLRVTTGTGIRPHLVFDVQGKLGFDFKVIEGATSSGGTAQTPFNQNRSSSNTADAVVTQNVTGVSGGTTILHGILSGGQKMGAAVDYDREFILEENESYIFEFTSLENSNIGNLLLTFYEP